MAVVFGLFVGGILGFAAAFSGRYVETLILRLIDVLYSFPDILIAMIMLAFLGPGIENATFAIGASFVPFYARLTYALSVGEKAKPYLEAARLAGIGPFRLIRVHVMPNISQSVVAVATLGFSSAVLSSAGLSFLGLGVQPPSPEWGAILASGRNYITKAPWLLLFPGFAIGLTVFSFQIAIDGMHDWFDPRRKFR
ncbi:ABC transporter permease (plasmid) [Sinorhizobium sp. B11]